MTKTLFLTGASSGIGAATARAAAKAGWNIGLFARSEDKLKDLATELGEQALVLVGDATDYDASIKVLEGRARDADSKYVDDELATLCGLYVLTKQLVVAHNTCDTAVASDRSYAAYNNRGVLRVHLKNVKGALDDFTHVRVPPEKRQLYIQELIRLDARLVANANYAECVRYAENRTDRDPNEALSERTKGAEVEEIIR